MLIRHNLSFSHLPKSSYQPLSTLGPKNACIVSVYPNAASHILAGSASRGCL
ncbi:hypothetical protein E6C60_3745 [Paenibacillus algicola]|uniref:Uncharacterized protein n=1 Tax=Paenibacillus algicola TaxID=2565926 RepID=A0A4P8XNL4_9BACL|nr:hypothetical protein E6C60_3745 [Paenibacillus algicola]